MIFFQRETKQFTLDTPAHEQRMLAPLINLYAAICILEAKVGKFIQTNQSDTLFGQHIGENATKLTLLSGGNP